MARMEASWKEKRPYIGIVLNVDGILFFAPFTSPKEKHLKMKNAIDFIKIDKGKLGAINFNNMIPIPFEECIKINVEKEIDTKYKNLLYKQINWCNQKENKQLILSKAKKLYNKYIENKLPSNIKNRCCNFIILEEKLKQYDK